RPAAAKYHHDIGLPVLDTDTRKAAASGMPAIAGARPVTAIESTEIAVSTRTDTMRNSTPSLVGAGAAYCCSVAPASWRRSRARSAVSGTGTNTHRRVSPR